MKLTAQTSGMALAIISLATSILSFPADTTANPEHTENAPKDISWFTDAKLGIFIHWGIYTVQQRGGESWPIVNGVVSYDDYMSQMEDFTAEDYNPSEWAELFSRAGAKYAVLTTKHHDGVALWPTKQESPNVPAANGTPDLVAPFVEALREHDLRVGLYFSHTDWSLPEHLSVLTGEPIDSLMELRSEATNYRRMWAENQKAHDLTGDPETEAKWQRFNTFHRAQLSEILGNYGPIDLIWFDGMFDRKGFGYDTAAIRDLIESFSPDTVINSRLGKHGDYETPEQFIPVQAPKHPWELCITMHKTWSYVGEKASYKSIYEIITMFCECLGMGGNMLLNVGPDPRGVIPEAEVAILEDLGRWTHKHQEAIYGTVAGLPHGYAYHCSTLNKSRDTLYLYLAHLPGESTPVKGIKNKIKSITVLGNDTPCPYKRLGGAQWMGVPSTIWIEVPESARDEVVTVLKIELDGPLDLYGGKGVEILVN